MAKENEIDKNPTLEIDDLINRGICPSCTWRCEIELENGVCPQCGINWLVGCNG